MFLFLILNLVFAQIPEATLQKFSTTAAANEVIRFKPIANHHFNLKAPQKCGEDGLVNKEPMEIQCQFKNPGDYKVILNVCDDKETYCKPERFNMKITAPKGFKSGYIKSSRENMVHVPKGERGAPKNFLSNNPAAALSQAKAQKKLLFIDFSAHWCPYCNMYDEYVFNEKLFQDKSKDYVKVKLDADSDISWEWKEKFKVGGYPTIIISNSNLEEIGRVVGYRNLTATAVLLDQFLAQKNESVVQAETLLNEFDKNPIDSKKDEMEQRRLRLGQNYFERGDFEKTMTLLQASMLPESERLKLMATAKLASKTGDKDKLQGTYEQLIQKFPADIEFASWVNEMAQLNVEKAKALIPTVESNVQAWLKNEKMIYEDYSEADLRQLQAEIYETVGQTDKAKEMFLKCASYYEPIANQSKTKVARGVNLERAYCLLKGGEAEKAKDLYKTMAQAYHGEFAFAFNYARALMDLNDFKQAYSFVNKAYMNAYGDNLLRAAILKAKLELKLNKGKEAKKTVTDTLSKFILPASTQIRSHRYYGQLKDILSEVEK